MASIDQKLHKTKDGNSIIIRSVLKEDANATLNIKHSSILEEIHQLVTPNEFKTTLESETKWIEKHLENPYNIALVAIQNNKIIGLISQMERKSEYLIQEILVCRWMQVFEVWE